MSNSYGFGNEEIKEESSWRYPLAIFTTTLILCAIFLYHYVGPGVEEIQGTKPKPTISEEKFDIAIGDRVFRIPANNTVYPKDRKNGARNELMLYALWPTLDGYTPAKRDEFQLNPYNGRRIDIIISSPAPLFNEQQRLETLYLPKTIDKRGSPYDFGLTQFTFKQDQTSSATTGYSDKDLLVGTAEDGSTLVLFCYKEDPSIKLAPECFREFNLTNKISIRYYFKRHYLPEWLKIDTAIRRFIYSLAQPIE
ncbi:MAG: hypothetical protein ACWA5L_02115 [bacterium]